MNSLQRGFHDFAQFAAKLKGDEKSEAQLFLVQLKNQADFIPQDCVLPPQ